MRIYSELKDRLTHDWNQNYTYSSIDRRII